MGRKEINNKKKILENVLALNKITKRQSNLKPEPDAFAVTHTMFDRFAN